MHTTEGMIEFTAGTGKGQGYLSVPRTARRRVLVLHAWWGLNDFFKNFCDRLAAEGYPALAPDLHRGKVAQTISEAKELMAQRDFEANRKDILGAVDYLHSNEGVAGRKIGVVGFSMGAAWALWLSTERPTDIGAVVSFYGTETADFSKAQASYLGHYALEDEWEPLNEVRALEERIRSAGRKVNFHYYPGTKHWFFEENRVEDYKPEAASLAWTRTLDFLRANVG